MTEQTYTQPSQEEITTRLSTALEKNYVLVSVIGAIIQFVWTISDYYTEPALWFRFFVVRTLGTLLIILFAVWYKKFAFKPVHCIFLAASVIATVSMFTTCSVGMETFGSLVLGNIVFFIGVGMLATWEIKYSFWLISITSFFILVFFNLFSPLTPGEFLAEGGIAFLSIAGVSILMVHSRYKSRYEEMRARLELEKSLELIKKKSKENNRLQTELHLREKSSIIGEITASISHELNTPLSVVLVGSKAIEENFNEVVKLFFTVNSEQWVEVSEVLEIISNRNMEFSTLKQISGSDKLISVFEAQTGKTLDPVLSRQIISSGITDQDHELLNKIGRHANFAELFLLIKKMRELKDFTRSLTDAVDKSTSIIQELKAIGQERKSEELKSVTVLSTIEKATKLFEQAHFSFLFKFRLDQGGAEIALRCREIQLIQLWFKLFDHLHNTLGHSTESFCDVHIVAEPKRAVVCFSIEAPFNKRIQRIGNMTTSILQEDLDIQDEFELNILQSLFTNLQAEVTVTQSSDLIKICVSLPLN